MHCCAARRRPVRELLGGLRTLVEVVVVMVGARQPQCLCGRLSGPSLERRPPRERNRGLERVRAGGSVRTPKVGNAGPAYRDVQLASFSCDNDHKQSLDPRAQDPTSQHTSLLYIALAGRIAGKCVDPCHL
jgi:hypothetical protein